MIWLILLVGAYWFVTAVGLLWADQRFGLGMTDGEPLLAGFYVLLAPILGPFIIGGGVVWLMGVCGLKVATMLAGKR